MLIHELKNYSNIYKLPIAMMVTGQCEYVSHWHFDFEAAFVLTGSVTVNLNGAVQRLRAGDAFICSDGDLHSYSYPSEDSRVMILMLDPIAARKEGTLVLDSEVRSSIFRPESPGAEERLRDVLEAMHREYSRLDETSAYFLYAYILEIQGILLRHYAKKEIPAGGQTQHYHLHSIREGISYIEDHFDSEITIAEMARRALMSVSNYSREFKKITGVGYKEYVSLVRLRKVTAAMKNERISISAIAYNCGFNSIRTFNRVFRGHYGITPGEYFKKARADHPAAHPQENGGKMP